MPRPFEVVGEVVAGLGFGHAGQGVAQRDPLVQCGKAPRLIRRRRVGWPSSRPVNGATESISLLVSSRSSLSWLAESRWASSTATTTARPRSCFSAARWAMVWAISAAVWKRGTPQAGHERGVEAAGPDRGVGQVDHGVAGGVELGQGGAQGDGLAGADLPGDDPERGLGHAPADPATASACPPWRCSIAGARLRRNGVPVKPK